MARELQSAPMTSASTTRTGRDKLRRGGQGINETRAAGVQIHRWRRNSQLMLHQAGDARQRHVGRERGHDQQVDFGGRNVGTGQAALRGGERHVAGGQFGRKDAPLADAGALQDPLGVKTERCQLFVVDHLIRHIAAGCEDLHTHQPAHRRPAGNRGMYQCGAQGGLCRRNATLPGRAITVGRRFAYVRYSTGWGGC